MTRWFCALTLAVVCATCSGGTGTTEQGTAPAEGEAASGKQAEKAAEQPALPVYREVTLPAGTSLPLMLKTSLASDTSQVEDAVRATLRQAVKVDGQTVLPAGTELVGTVTDVARSARVKGRARVAFRFNSLRYDDERYPITTSVIAREAESGTKEDVKKVGIGAGVGAALGAVLGGGSGAAKGAAIGGAAGTGAVLATRGKEVQLGAGTDVTTKLTERLTLRVKS